MYDEKFADVYDDVYRCHMDYSLLATRIRELAVENAPGATTLLDVACGTGEHLTYLREHFTVTGTDLAEPMLRVARAKLPGVALSQADMRSFDLGAKFDVVTCMYASVAYINGLDDLHAAVRTMAAHLAPGGVMIVEPWVFREDWDGGHLVDATFRAPSRTVTRMGRWTTRDGRSHVEMNYLVGDETGVRHFTDVQSLRLFSRAEYEGAFEAAGCKPRYLPNAYADRQVFLATHTG
ncbi:class I SAM-dependent methyltransferase [Lentzea sp. NPDC060358]|uniref:class I SAM-dependent methyltransferase n=1 Tax=Lentzea sp. NPDC060358 TaxID=3347103 RepID=UPI003649BB0B